VHLKVIFVPARPRTEHCRTHVRPLATLVQENLMEAAARVNREKENWPMRRDQVCLAHLARLARPASI
jgi:hypothetical protein